ncbi:MAG: DNA translocase FtsK [Chloroflexi bacterium]|nr:DNA translocase FtsK [Chloroflexota bacterium]
MSKQRVSSSRVRQRARPSHRRQVAWRRLLPILSSKFVLGACLIGVAAFLVMTFGPMVLAAIVLVLTAVGEALAEFFGLGVVLLIALLFVVSWLAWRRQFLRSLRWWDRWVAALAFGAALFGLAAFFGGESLPSSGSSLIKKSAGGLLGQAIIGAPSLAGFLRVMILGLLGVIVLWPRQTWRLSSDGSRRLYSRSRMLLPEIAARAKALAAMISGAWQARRVAVAGAAPEPVEASAMPAAFPDPIMRAGAPVETAGSDETAGEVIMAAPSGEGWQLPPYDIADRAPETELSPSDAEARARKIEEALASYGVDSKVVQVNSGPAITQFGVEPGWDIKYKVVKERDADGRIRLDRDGNPREHREEVSRTRVKVERITSLTNDLALALAAPTVRIEAPVPGKALVGIEVPNISTGLVSLRSVIESTAFQRARARSKLAMALGKGVSGEAVVGDLARMPHLLIAGATGSGKSVCINSTIACLLMHTSPDEVRFLMIDPKRVELVSFNNIPHLLAPVVVEMEQVVGILRWVTKEMDRRYVRLASAGARNIEAYNRSPKASKPMPYLIVIIDELADLMMVAPYEVERTICRLAQLARATGIHLIIATQRPSVDVVTGLIKANFPTRIAFAVTSQVDSRTILDMAGAEKLLGQGDMLYMPTDAAKPKRLQGCFVSDQEIERLVKFWSGDRWASLRPAQFTEELAQAVAMEETGADDALMEKARKLVAESGHVSTSLLQRRLRIGYPRAARLMEALEEEGTVEPRDRKSRDPLAASDEEGEGDMP